MKIVSFTGQKEYDLIKNSLTTRTNSRFYEDVKNYIKAKMLNNLTEDEFKKLQPIAKDRAAFLKKNEIIPSKGDPIANAMELIKKTFGFKS